MGTDEIWRWVNEFIWKNPSVSNNLNQNAEDLNKPFASISTDEGYTVPSKKSTAFLPNNFHRDGYFCIVGQVKPRDANNIFAKFADDTYLISSAAKRHTILDELEAIHDWASSKNLKLNTSKTKELLFAHGGQWTELQPQLLGLRIEKSLH